MEDRIWIFVQSCWAQSPAERPTSAEGAEIFEGIARTDSVKLSHHLMFRYFITGEISFQRLFDIKTKDNVKLRGFIREVRTSGSVTPSTY